ncbi:expressed unknown protein [Seminavis robusta]|uniref:Uncharacterized protein n=1 Tax=Seminavis robusta TaxID=568900 RepID=A0A9N8H8Z3_9STRA|nr:expressed unknown protein [Seminavis robusta]|eukprot:Sro257_g100880.1 n/a (347) ;mRNA; r:46107-47246
MSSSKEETTADKANGTALAAEPEFTIDGADGSAMDQIHQSTVSSAPPPPAHMFPPAQRSATNAHTSTTNPLPAQVPLAADDTSNANSSFASQLAVDRSMFGPSTGQWSTKFFSCFQVFFTALFWMGCFCFPCVYGQLLQRMNMDLTGRSPHPERPRVSGVCMSVLVMTTLVYCFWWMGVEGFLVDVMNWLFIGYCIFMGFILRSKIRKRFGIAPITTFLTLCDGILEDILLAVCCNCCSAIQMARHTHDESRFPYNGCSTNGLPSYAPHLWDGPALLGDDNDNPAAAARRRAPHQYDIHPAYRSSPAMQEMVEYPYQNNNNHSSSSIVQQPQSSKQDAPMTNVEIV